MFSAPFEQSFGALTRRSGYLHENINFEDLSSQRIVGIGYEQVIYVKGTDNRHSVCLEAGDGCKI